ncbi:MAG: hypothetical protein ACK5NT_02415 [Pyrinomonadaceae bacterium]
MAKEEINITNCPKCGSVKQIDWDELNTRDPLVAAQLPGNTKFPMQTRKMHKFCSRCLFEFGDENLSTRDLRV